MTATSPIERVVLTHLQIPLKEPFRISGGEVAVKDAILVTVETSIGHRPRARARRWPRASATRPTRPRGAGTTWHERDRPEPARPDRSTRPTAIADGRVDLDGRAGSPSPGPRPPSGTCSARRATRPSPSCSGPIDEQVSLGVESGLAVGLYPIDRRAAQGDRDPPGRGLPPGQDQDPAGQRRRARPRRAPALRRRSRSWSTPTAPTRAADIDVFRAARRVRPPDVRAADGGRRPRRPGRAAEGRSPRRSASTRRPRRSSRPPRRSAAGPAGSSTSRSSASAGSGPARAIHDLCHQHGVACWVGTMPELGIGQAARHPPGDAGQLQVPDRHRAARPLVRRRLRRSAARARLAGPLQRPRPAPASASRSTRPSSAATRSARREFTARTTA